MGRIKKIIFVILGVTHCLSGDVFETSQFEELLTHIEEQGSKSVLVVCDIDNTLLMGSHHLGSVAWARHMVVQLQRKGMSKRQAQEIEDILWQTVQPLAKVKSVDPRAPSVLQEIQRKGIPVLALTARAPEEAEYTMNQLLSLGIDLSLNEWYPGAPIRFVMEERDALYEKGILFGTIFNRKSSVLFNFLDSYAISPECIIFVDDQRNHVEDLERVCKERDITYVGIRFSAADEYIKSFDPHLAEIQWEAFPTLLSNEEAKLLALDLPMPK